MFIRHKERGSHRVTPFMQTHQQGHTVTQMHPPDPPTHIQIHREESHTQNQDHKHNPTCTPHAQTRKHRALPGHPNTHIPRHTHTLIRPGHALALLSHPHDSSALGAGAASPPQAGRGGACGRAALEPRAALRAFSSPRPLGGGGASERGERERGNPFAVTESRHSQPALPGVAGIHVGAIKK